MCVFRGWGVGNPTSPTYTTPVSNVKVTANAQSVWSTSKGEALFLNLTAGTYTLTTDPTFVSMMVFPGDSHNSPQSITLSPSSTGVTQQRNVLVEYPSRINVFTKEALNDTPVSVSGAFTLNQPYGGNKNINFANSDINGKIPDNYLPDMWPVGIGFVGKYDLINFNIPGYVPSVKNKWDLEENKIWSGEFNGPRTEKDIIIYLLKTPVIPPPSELFANDWVLGGGNSHNINTKPSSPIAYGQNNEIIGASFNTFNSNNIDAKNQISEFWASQIYFPNRILEIKEKGALILHSNQIYFKNNIDFYPTNSNQASGELKLYTISNDILYKGTTYTANQDTLDLLKDGSQLQNINGEKGISGVDYGLIYFENDIYEGNQKILEKGAYYFPNGASLPNVIDKSPSQGGLIRM